VDHGLGGIRGIQIDVDSLRGEAVEGSVPLDVDGLGGVNCITLLGRLVESTRRATYRISQRLDGERRREMYLG